MGLSILNHPAIGYPRFFEPQFHPITFREGDQNRPRYEQEHLLRPAIAFFLGQESGWIAAIHTSPCTIFFLTFRQRIKKPPFFWVCRSNARLELGQSRSCAAKDILPVVVCMRKEACLGHFGKAELGWEFWTLGGIHSVLRRERRSYGDTHTHMGMRMGQNLLFPYLWD